MKYPSIEDAISDVLRQDARFSLDAYLFVKDALDYTVKTLSKPSEGPDRHVSGNELLEGIRAYAIDQFGPVTLTVLHYWGISQPRDFGEIVFNMVEHGILGKTDEDTREDFEGGYDFSEAFEEPFLPVTRVEEEPGSATRMSRPSSAMEYHD